MNYSPAFQDALAAQLETIPAGTPISVGMADYGRLRDQARACRGVSVR